MNDKPIRSKDDFLVFGKPVIEEAEIEEVVDSLRSGWIGTGPKTAQFEKQFAEYKGVNSAVAVNSGSSALFLALNSLELKNGDEIITTALTFCATVNAIIHAGGTPILADVNPETHNIDPEELKGRITNRTKAIVPVHMAGRPCEMDAICEIADRHGLAIIEDCAHAIETEYKGRKAGTIGDFGCFSFYATKNITAAEGGMIVARDTASLDNIRTLSMNGLSADAWNRYSDSGYVHYFVTEAGYKLNMTDLNAAIGIHQLKRIESMYERRKEIWDRYNEELCDLPITLPASPAPTTRHAFHLYSILIDEEKCGISRDKLLEHMTAEGIGTGVHYLSLAEHPYYQNAFGWTQEDYPIAMKIGRQTVSLPLSGGLTDRDVDDVIKAVLKTF